MSIPILDLERMPYEELVGIIEGISDSQAENSDIGGDTDPEDDLPLNLLSNSSRFEDLRANSGDDDDHSDTPTPITSGALPILISPPRHPSDSEDDHMDEDPPSQGPSAVLTQGRGRGRVRTRGGRARTRGPVGSRGRGSVAGSSRAREEDLDSDDDDMDEDSVSQDPPTVPTRGGRGRVRTRGGRARGPSGVRRSANSGRQRIPLANPYRFVKVYRAPQEYKNHRFQRKQGIHVEVNISSPLQIFMLFFTTEVLQHIVDQSNIYSNALHLEMDELKAFLGIIIIMGLHGLPSTRLYWSTDQNFFFPRIANLMTLKRFLKILRYLHLNDNATMRPRGDPQHDRLHKVRPLLNMLSENFKKSFNPSRFLSVDESMIPFKGRSMLKQYMPLKPVKRGFKVWVVCCAVTGYMMAMNIYEGKTNDTAQAAEAGLGEQVVMKLTETFAGLGFCVYFDRFFCSIVLLSKLLEKKIFACGTLMATRKYFPADKLRDDREMATGDFDSVMSESISITKWKDRGKRCVLMASNMHNPASITSVNRTNKLGRKEQVRCPQSIADYNRYMGGVDRFDQRMAAYTVSWKSRRWWIKIFYYCLDAAIVNAYILYREVAKDVLPRSKVLSHLMFRSLLADELVGEYQGRKRRSVAPNKPLFKADQPHFPTKSTSKRCSYCSSKAKPVRTKIGCDVCEIGLCITCFKDFHNNGCKKKE